MSSQKENFLQEYIDTPLQNTIVLATVITKSNPMLVFTNIIIYFSLISLLSLSATRLNFDENLSLLLAILLFAVFMIILVFSNIIYMGKTIKESNSLEQLILNIQTSTLKDFYFKWFNIASGHFLSLLVIFLLMMPLYLLKEVDGLFLVPVGIVVLLFLYTQILIINLVVSSSNFKEGFSALFQIFRPSFIKTSFNLTYFGFMFTSGVLIKILSKLSDLPAKMISSNEESLSFIFTDALFIALFNFFAFILYTAIASALSKEIVTPKTTVVSEND